MNLFPMKLYSIKISTLLIVFTMLCAACMPVNAESYLVSCKKRPNSISSVKRALEAKVLSLVDTTKFDSAKVTARFVLLGTNLQNQQISAEQLLSGVNVTDSADPTGLAFGVNGSLSVGNATSCVYNYRVAISVRGVDKATSQKLVTRTESTLSITAPPSGSLKRTS